MNLPRHSNTGLQVDHGMADDSEISAQHKEKTIVSFVLDEHTDSYEKEKEERKRNSTSRSRVSILYAIIVTLIGVAFPVTEALRDQWLTEWAVGAFLMYLFSLSSVFLVYLMIVQLRRKLSETGKKRKLGEQGHKNPAFKETDGDVLAARRRSIPGDADRGYTTHSSAEGENQQPSLPNNPRGLSIEEIPGLHHMYPATRHTAMATPNGTWRAPPRLSDPSPSPTLRRRRLTIGTEDGDDFNMDDFEGYEDEIVEYITVHSQTASLGHEGTSLYLRLGCIFFGLANLVYVAMEIEYYQGGHISPDCPDYPVIWPMYFHLMFLVVQTFFLFKHTTLQVKRQRGLVRLGLMHVLATNLCVWARFLVREVMEGVYGGHHSLPGDTLDDIGRELNTSSSCYDGDSLMKEASPYLFPFVLEYSLIAIATYASMYAGLDVKITKDLMESVKKTLVGARDPKQQSRDPDESAADGHGQEQGQHHGVASFGKAHRGLFMGMLVLAGVITTIAMFFYTLRSQKIRQTATLIYHVGDIILNALLLVAVVHGLFRFFRMGFSDERSNTIDNVLLVVSFTGLFMFDIFIIISNFVYIDLWDYNDVVVLDAVGGLLSIVQAVLQTIFISDGLQRYAITRRQEREMPGRGTVTFMIIANVGMWVFKTFQVKELALGRQEDFYGETPWQIILNISLPLMLFFRFHSSVCLADMYAEAFKPEEKPLTFSYVL